MTKNGNKATIREVRDLIDKLDDEKISPMKESLTRIETKLDMHLDSCNDYRKKNDNKHETIIKILGNKISIKAFASWLSITTVIMTTVITIIIRVLGG